MAKSRMSLLTRKGGGETPTEKAIRLAKQKDTTQSSATQSQVDSFGSLGVQSGDTGAMGAKLRAAGIPVPLQGTSPDYATVAPGAGINVKEGLKYGSLGQQSADFNQPSTWVPIQTSEMLRRARIKGLKKPEEIEANKAYLLADTPYKDAVNHPDFEKLYPGYWDKFKGLIKDQYAKEIPAPQMSLLAKK